MVSSFMELLKVNSTVRILGVIILFAFAESAFLLPLLMVDSLADALENETRTYWRFAAVAVVFFVMQTIALFAYPYYVGKKFGKFGLLFGALWSISIMLFLPAFGYVASELVDVKFGPTGYELAQNLTGDGKGFNIIDLWELFVLPVGFCWLGELSAKRSRSPLKADI